MSRGGSTNQTPTTTDRRAASREKNAAKNARKTLDEAEEIQILEDVARGGSAIARLQALKMLRPLRAPNPKADEEPKDDFAELDELAPRRAHRG